MRIFSTEVRNLPSVRALIAANIILLVMALALRWDVRTLYATLWAENLLVCAFTLMKIAVVDRSPGAVWPIPKGEALVAYPLFYAVMLFLLAFFIQAIVNIGEGNSKMPDNWTVVSPITDIVGSLSIPAAVIMGLSHGYSYVSNFLNKPGNRQTSDMRLLGALPVERMLVIDIVLLFVGYLVLWAGEFMLVVLFCLIKTVLDVLAHCHERMKTEAPRASIPSTSE